MENISPAVTQAEHDLEQGRVDFQASRESAHEAEGPSTPSTESRHERQQREQQDTLGETANADSTESQRDSADEFRDSGQKVVVLSFRALQLQHIVALQDKLVHYHEDIQELSSGYVDEEIGHEIDDF